MPKKIRVGYSHCFRTRYDLSWKNLNIDERGILFFDFLNEISYFNVKCQNIVLIPVLPIFGNQP